VCGRNFRQLSGRLALLRGRTLLLRVIRWSYSASSAKLMSLRQRRTGKHYWRTRTELRTQYIVSVLLAGSELFNTCMTQSNMYLVLCLLACRPLCIGRKHYFEFSRCHFRTRAVVSQGNRATQRVFSIRPMTLYCYLHQFTKGTL